MRKWLLVGALAGCAGGGRKESGIAPGTDPCAAAEHAAPTSEAALAALLADVQAAVHAPGLDGVEVGLAPMTSDSDFFTAGPDLTTVDRPGPERRYIVRYNTRVFETGGPPVGATSAILGHELQHVADYVGMTSDELVDFALTYAEGDIAAYERQTDEAVLEAGCADGLKAYRVWLYEQIDAEAEAAKRRDYYTPEEIDVWVAEHG